MEFYADNDTLFLHLETKQDNCLQGDPHCIKNFGGMCEKGCFEVTIDLQTLSVVDERKDK